MQVWYPSMDSVTPPLFQIVLSYTCVYIKSLYVISADFDPKMSDSEGMTSKIIMQYFATMLKFGVQGNLSTNWERFKRA